MLILGLFILLLVSAISQERINGIIINRAATLVLLYSFFLSISTLNVAIIGSGIGVFGGLYQVTIVSKIVECFIYLLGGLILSNTMVVTRNGMSNLSNYQLPLKLKKVELTKLELAVIEKKSSRLKSEYSIIALFSVVGAVLLITSNDLVSMYLSIELQSFALYVIATIYRDSQASTYAGLKYFLLGGLSSGFILLGSSILYAYTGVTNLESIYILISRLDPFLNEKLPLIDLIMIERELQPPLFSKSFVEIGLLIMSVGFLFKIAAAPFHNWAPDVYDGVPIKITTWLAIMAKISILTFLLDLAIAAKGSLVVLTDSSLDSIEGVSILSNLFLIVGFLSLLIGTIVGLAQSRIKRLLAYSTITHIGFLLLAIAINTTDSIESFIFYLIQYSLTSGNAFFVLIAFSLAADNKLISLSTEIKRPSNLLLATSQEEKNNKEEIRGHLHLKKVVKENSSEREYSPVQFIKELRGKFNEKGRSSLLALSLAVVLFSMAGIPPLIGFFGKQAVLLSAVKNGYLFLSIVGIITSVISAAYYLRVIKIMVFEEELKKKEDSENQEKPLFKRKMGFDLTVPERVPRTIPDNKSKDYQTSQQEKIVLDELSSKKIEKGITKKDINQMSNSLSFCISILTVLIILFFFKPTLILNLAHIMALSLFYI